MLQFDRFTPEGQRFLQQLQKLQQLEVVVGFHRGEQTALRRTGTGGSSTAETDIDIADVAMWNEFGTVHTPARPFYRDSIAKINEMLPAFWASELKRVMAGGSAEQSFQKLGVLAKGVIQDTILTGNYEPNKDATIARKGSSQPLIDTGRMRQSVNFVVKPIGGGGR